MYRSELNPNGVLALVRWQDTTTLGLTTLSLALKMGVSVCILIIMKTVAIIGASNNRQKFGNKAVRAFRSQGFEVYPVNPKEAVIEGLIAFKNVRDIPVRPAMVSVYVPPEVLLTVLPDIAARGCDELWLNPGSESPAVIAEAERLGLNVIQACSIIGVGVSPGSL